MMDIDRQMAVIKRGVAELIDEKELRKKLERGTPLRVKVGFDPTALTRIWGHVGRCTRCATFRNWATRSSS